MNINNEIEYDKKSEPPPPDAQIASWPIDSSIPQTPSRSPSRTGHPPHSLYRMRLLSGCGCSCHRRGSCSCFCFCFIPARLQLPSLSFVVEDLQNLIQWRGDSSSGTFAFCQLIATWRYSASLCVPVSDSDPIRRCQPRDQAKEPGHATHNSVVIYPMSI